MNIQQALSNITKNIHLTQAQMEDVMRIIMQGEATQAQIGALMMGLRLKGESIDEITAAARVMREFAIKIDVSDLPHLVDIVGTGGDGQNLGEFKHEVRQFEKSYDNHQPLKWLSIHVLLVLLSHQNLEPLKIQN